jgi:hypothetical protein
MFDNERINTRFRAIHLQFDEIIHLDTMLVAGTIPAFARLPAHAFSAVREALLRGGLRLFPGIRNAEAFGDLEQALDRMLHLDTLGFLVRATQPIYSIEGQALVHSWTDTRSAWFFARTYEDVLRTAYKWAAGAREQTLARTLGFDLDSLIEQERQGH